MLLALASIYLKDDTDYAIDKVLIACPGRDHPFVIQVSNADSCASVNVVLENGAMDSLPCTMDVMIYYS